MPRTMFRIVPAFTLVLLASMLLAACGQKGDLVRPEPGKAAAQDTRD